MRELCEHKNWTVYGYNSASPPCGTCLDCKKEIPLDALLRGTAKRLQELERRLEENLEKMESKK